MLVAAGADEARKFEPLGRVAIDDSRRISLGLGYFCRGTCLWWISLWRTFGEPPEQTGVDAPLTEPQDEVDSEADENHAICDDENLERIRRAIVEEQDVQHDS